MLSVQCDVFVTGSGIADAAFILQKSIAMPGGQSKVFVI
jgi:hypothetical protein